MSAYLGKKGAVEFDKLVVIVIALAVLLIVVIFFKTGYGSIGGSVGSVSKSATDQAPSLKKNMSTGISSALGGWGGDSGTATTTTTTTTTTTIHPVPCNKAAGPPTGAGSCVARSGICIADTTAMKTQCYNSPGTWMPASEPRFQCSSGEVCCCGD